MSLALARHRRRAAKPSTTFSFKGKALPTGITITRASGATRINQRGYMETVGNNVLRYTYDPSLEYNTIRNPWMDGASAPSTYPTFWSPQGSTGGLSRSVVGTGIEDGIPYLDLRIFGTTNATNAAIRIDFDALKCASARSGEAWTASVYTRLISGNHRPAGNEIMHVFVQGFTEAGGQVEQSSTEYAAALTTAPLIDQIRSHTRTLNNAATAYAESNFYYVVPTSGTVVDFTVRIGFPTLTQNATHILNRIPLATLAARVNGVPQYGLEKALVERIQATNLLGRSQTLTTWSSSPGGSVAATNNVITAPDGTLTAGKVTTNDTANSGHLLYTSFSGAVSTTYTFSMFLKEADYRYAALSLANTGFTPTSGFGAVFDLRDGAVVVLGAGTTAYPPEKHANGWWRCIVTATSDADGGAYIPGLAPYPTLPAAFNALYTPASTGLGVYAWGAQVEVGNFASSYIASDAGSPTTRLADIMDIDPTKVDFDKSTIGIGFRAERGGVDVVALGNQHVLGARDAGGNNLVRVRTQNGQIDPQGFLTRAGASPNIPTSTLGSGIQQAVVLAWDATSGVASWSGNAAENAGPGPIGPPSAVQIGADGASANAGNNTITAIEIFKRRKLTGRQLQRLSARLAAS